MPSKGTANQLDSTSVRWEIDELGVSQSEGAVLLSEVDPEGNEYKRGLSPTIP